MTKSKSIVRLYVHSIYTCMYIHILLYVYNFSLSLIPGSTYLRQTMAVSSSIRTSPKSLTSETGGVCNCLWLLTATSLLAPVPSGEIYMSSNASLCLPCLQSTATLHHELPCIYMLITRVTNRHKHRH